MRQCSQKSFEDVVKGAQSRPPVRKVRGPLRGVSFSTLEPESGVFFCLISFLFFLGIKFQIRESEQKLGHVLFPREAVRCGMTP